jgi:hypothetical protein
MREPRELPTTPGVLRQLIEATVVFRSNGDLVEIDILDDQGRMVVLPLAFRRQRFRETLAAANRFAAQMREDEAQSAQKITTMAAHRRFPE